MLSVICYSSCNVLKLVIYNEWTAAIVNSRIIHRPINEWFTHKYNKKRSKLNTLYYVVNERVHDKLNTDKYSRASIIRTSINRMICYPNSSKKMTVQ